ncbi:MAG TPA: ATP-dependent Clp protease adapter ClpS [Kiritimatiellia bacterium]|nr:ATP-dependent Clp protease adapter ClpS [Kiritimatiellia bacterium]
MADTLTVPKPTGQTEETLEHAPVWNVIVWNDPVNLMTYVVFVLQQIFGYNRERATRLMLEVHRQGKSVVATEDFEHAELHVAQLHGYGLQATLQKVEG